MQEGHFPAAVLGVLPGADRNWWETFAEMEAELRQMMDEDKDHTRGAELVAQMEGNPEPGF